MKNTETLRMPFEWFIWEIGRTTVAVMAIAAIHYRLSRIETKLQLTPYNAFVIEQDVHAHEKTLRNNPQYQGEKK